MVKYVLLVLTTLISNLLASSPPIHPLPSLRFQSRQSTANNVTLWSYTGSLTNPVTGARICGVNGLESIKRVSKDETMSKLQRGGEKYAILGKILRAFDGVFAGGDAETDDFWYLSRRCFCYTGADGRLLSRYR